MRFLNYDLSIILRLFFMNKYFYGLNLTIETLNWIIITADLWYFGKKIVKSTQDFHSNG